MIKFNSSAKIKGARVNVSEIPIGGAFRFSGSFSMESDAIWVRTNGAELDEVRAVDLKDGFIGTFGLEEKVVAIDITVTYEGDA